MGIPRLRESLCGCKIETGSMILAWLSVIGVSLELLIGTIFYAFGHESLELYVKKHYPENYEEGMLQIKILLAFVTVILIFSLAINTMLLLGVHKRNHCLMMPWLILSGCGCAINLLSFGFHLLAALFSPELLIGAFVHGIGTAVGVYFFLIVYSFYHEVKEEKQMNDCQRFKPLGA